MNIRLIRGDRAKRRAKVAARIALAVLGIALATVALTVGSLVTIARTDWGGERLRRMVVTRANQSMRGHLEMGRLRFGGDRLVISDVTLRDPDGQVAAQVARVEVDFRIAPLLKKEVRLTHVKIQAPRVVAVSGPEGMNLTRATEPRTKKPPSKASPPGSLLDKEGWVLRLDDLLLTEGDVVVASATPASRKETIHLAGLHLELGARYATGNGATDLQARLAGRSVRAPAGLEALSADVHRHADATRVAVDGALLGGNLRIRGEVLGPELDLARTTLTASVTLPRTSIAGFEWGPFRLEADAAPGRSPTLELLAAIPGLQLTAGTPTHATDPAASAPASPTTAPAPAANGPSRPFPVRIDARLVASDLATTGKALENLLAGDQPTLAGHGDLSVSVEGVLRGGPGATQGPWQARCKGLFDGVRVGEIFVSGLTIEGHATPLAMTTNDAALSVAVSALRSGTTKLTRLRLDLGAQRDTLTLAASLAGPSVVSVAADSRLDADRRGLALTRLSVTLPRARWATTQPARVRSDDSGTSLHGLRLEADGGQLLALDGAKTTTRMNAHLGARLRLELLPAPLVDPSSNLAGVLHADATAAGDTAAPRVVAQVRLDDGRFQKFSRIKARVDATFADRIVNGTLGAEAPFAALDGSYRVPIDLLTTSVPVSLSLDATRVDLSEMLRGAGKGTPADGKLTAHLRVRGSAGDPRVDLAIDGLNLRARPSAAAATGKNPGRAPTTPAAMVDVGRVHVDLAYAERLARAWVDFDTAHGGRLHANATTRIDLSYPAVTAPVDVKRLPIHGKVVARDFDVAWISPFSARIESLKGTVTADARLGGTVADPQVLGDVRWNNGQVVTVEASEPATSAGQAKALGTVRGRASGGHPRTSDTPEPR